ncbi:pilus assembly PilX family protein [Comamonas jiangduensis]|uniref:pilus assembly PilX family protein n=1 Tax=Comamonas jiangduensis TaxID=1194168 RepID=UPI001583D141|nr:PilX N-terminal domain-containing pilus assembly protein [Comamonas jiangduensis]
MQTPHHQHPPHRRQRGAALFVVIVFVMLSMLLALWASRTALFSEMIVGNDADYQRAFEAAQALLQDAELDIRGEMADGSACIGPPCRAYQPNSLQFPADAKEVPPLLTQLEAEATRCKHALCVRRVGRQDFWNYKTATTEIPSAANTTLGEVPLSALTRIDDETGLPLHAARYGQYTGAANTTANGPINPILTATNPERGWYWIEIMRYSDTANNSTLITDAATNQLPLNLDLQVIYRITAVALGRKAETMVVLQQTYARQRMKD